MTTTRVLLISGSLRHGSTNDAILRTAQHVAPEQLEMGLFPDLGNLPHFNPDLDGDNLPTAVRRLRDDLARSQAVLISTPEYAGALPGAFKNLLEWTIGGSSLVDKPVAWINVSTSPGAASDALHSLRIVLRYTGASIVEKACANIPLPRHLIGEDGLVNDISIQERLRSSLSALRAETPG